MSALLAVAMAIIPGTPAMPFLLLAFINGGGAAYVSWKNSQVVAKAKQVEQIKAKQEVPVQEEPIS